MELEKTFAELSSEELIKILRENDATQYTGEALEAARRVLLSRDVEPPEQLPALQRQDEIRAQRDTPIGGNADLEQVIVDGKSRRPWFGYVGLNALLVLNTITLNSFGFGIFFVLAFNVVGRTRHGIIIVLLMLGIGTLTRLAGIFPLGMLVGLLLYLWGWISANRTLAGYNSSARSRVAKLEGQQEIDALLETGVLQYSVLKEKPAGIAALDRASEMDGGDRLLLSVAGDVMQDAGKTSTAGTFMSRARLVKKLSRSSTTFAAPLDRSHRTQANHHLRISPGGIWCGRGVADRSAGGGS